MHVRNEWRFFYPYIYFFCLMFCFVFYGFMLFNSLMLSSWCVTVYLVFLDVRKKVLIFLCYLCIYFLFNVLADVFCGLSLFFILVGLYVSWLIFCRYFLEHLLLMDVRIMGWFFSNIYTFPLQCFFFFCSISYACF